LGSVVIQLYAGEHMSSAGRALNLINGGRRNQKFWWGEGTKWEKIVMLFFDVVVTSLTW